MGRRCNQKGRDQRGDMTQARFDDACRRWGFTPKGFLGYYSLPCGVEVSVLNAGPNRRARLAYLIAEEQKQAKRNAERRAKATGLCHPSGE